MVLELLDQPLDFVLACCILLLDCRKRCSSYSMVHGVVTDFTVTFSNRWMVPKMILRFGFVDFVDYSVSLILARLVALSEFSVLSGRAHQQFSYIPLSQCKLQAVCCSERLHVTAFGKIAAFSLGRTSNCTKILYFESVSKYSCVARSLFCQIACSFSHATYVVHRIHACLPLLKLFPPAINPFLITEFNSFAFPTW